MVFPVQRVGGTKGLIDENGVSGLDGVVSVYLLWPLHLTGWHLESCG